MNTYEKHRGGGQLWLTRIPEKEFYPEESATKDLSSNPAKDFYPESPRGSEGAAETRRVGALAAAGAPTGRRLVGVAAVEEAEDYAGGDPIVGLVEAGAEGGAVEVGIEETDVDVAVGMDVDAAAELHRETVDGGGGAAGGGV